PGICLAKKREVSAMDCPPPLCRWRFALRSSVRAPGHSARRPLLLLYDPMGTASGRRARLLQCGPGDLPARALRRAAAFSLRALAWGEHDDALPLLRSVLPDRPAEPSS